MGDRNMKNKLNVALLLVWIASAAACVAGVLFLFDLWWLALPAVPSFCSQLLLCRVSDRRWVRALPALVCGAVLASAGLCVAHGGQWGSLEGLLLTFAGAAGVTGVVFGWVAFLPRKNNGKQDKEQ